jgi:putative signal transducing protein
VRTVFTAQSPAEAHLVAGVLEEAGIRCFVEGEMLFGVRADIGLTPASLPRVCVRDEDTARAVEVIAPHVRRSEEAAREEDPDAAPLPPLALGAVRIVVLWLLIPAVLVPVSLTATFVALPLAAVAIWVHLLRHFDRPA